MSARLVSAPHAEPRPCSASQERISATLLMDRPSATFEPEPTEMNMRRPSLEKATSRVLCPPVPAHRTGTIVSAAARARRSPLR